MMAKDESTLGFYATEASAYAARGMGAAIAHIEPFAALLPAGGSVLELGCGAGQDSEALLALGFDVSPTDGSAELAAKAAQRLGREVRVLLFENLSDRDAYDGIWANACLLHVPRAALPDILERIHRALKPGGVFYASFKAGEAEGRDRFGRYFNYPSATWLGEAAGSERWASFAITDTNAPGYDGEDTPWLHVMAVKKP